MGTKFALYIQGGLKKRGQRLMICKCGGIVDILLTTNLPRNLPVKKLFKSVKN